jgi:hypothetical protein
MARRKKPQDSAAGAPETRLPGPWDPHGAYVPCERCRAFSTFPGVLCLRCRVSDMDLTEGQR